MTPNSTIVRSETGPRTLFVDIETSPNVVHTWGLFNQTIGLSQLIVPSGLLCFAAKWRGRGKPMFFSDRASMVKDAHALMSEADVIVHYNGSSFDIPILNSEVAVAGLQPPSPSKHVDLYRVVKRNFRFPSGKLAYISKALGLEGKISHSGHELWIKCMAGDPAAWKKMRAYNVRDVTLLEELYDILLPWVSNHPSVALYAGKDGCPNCGSGSLRKEGYSYTATGKYQRFQCRGCGSWSKSSKRVAATTVRSGA